MHFCCSAALTDARLQKVLMHLHHMHIACAYVPQHLPMQCAHCTPVESEQNINEAGVHKQTERRKKNVPEKSATKQ